MPIFHSLIIVYSSTEKRINKIWYIHTVEYYLAVKRKATPIHATTQMNFKNIMPSEIDQPQKEKICDSTYTKYLASIANS